MVVYVRCQIWTHEAAWQVDLLLRYNDKVRKYQMIPYLFELHPKSSLIVTCFLISVAIAASTEIQFEYSSTQIKCSIWFTRHAPSPDSSAPLTFVNCTLTECTSFKVTGQCKIDQKFRLDAKTCFLDCCHLTEFDDQACRDYAIERDEEKAQSDSAIIIILGSCLGAIFLSTLIFAFCYLKCFKNYETQVLREINDKASDKNLNYSWRAYKFQNTHNCAKCNAPEASIMLSCEHFCHLECLKAASEWQCPGCKKPIVKTRVFCTVCCSYYVTLKADCAQRLEEQITESYWVHPEKCSQNTMNELSSDRKFTVSTKE